MTELQAENAIKTYQKKRREARNLDLALGMRSLLTAEQFLSALHALEGINTKEREAARRGEILQTLA